MADNNNPHRRGIPIKSPMDRAKKSRASSSHDLLSPLNTLDAKSLSHNLPPSKIQNPLSTSKSSFPLKLEKLPQSYSSGNMSLSESSFSNLLTRYSLPDVYAKRTVDLSSDPEPIDYQSVSLPTSNSKDSTPKKSPSARTINVDKVAKETPTKFPCLPVASIQFRHLILPLVHDLTHFTDMKLSFIPNDRLLHLSARVYGSTETIVAIPYAKISRIQFIRRERESSADWHIDLVLSNTSSVDLSFFQKYNQVGGNDEEHFKNFTTLRVTLSKNCGMGTVAIENLLLPIVVKTRFAINFTESRDPYGDFELSSPSVNSDISSTPPKPLVKNTYTTTNTTSPSTVRIVPSFESLASSDSVRLKSSSLRSIQTRLSRSEGGSLAPSPKQYIDDGRRTSKRLKASPSTSPFKKDPDSFTYVDPDFEGTDSVKLFSYPEGEIDSVLVTSHELERLEPGIWLNDTLIDFELKYLKTQLDRDLQAKIHVFSSFFYRRLTSAKLTKSDDSDAGKTGFDLVKTWTRKVNLFEKDYVIVPINENLHWFLAIICHPSRILSDAESEKNDTNEKDHDTNSQSSESSLIMDLDPDMAPSDGSKIFIFDSLGLASRGKGAAVIRKLKTYLKLEAHDKLGRQVVKDACTGNSVKVPQQENYTDCGCFLLQFVDEFFQSIPAGIETQISERGYDFSDWFEPVLAQNRRSIMKERIRRLAADFAAREALKTPAERNEDAEHEDRSSDIEEIIM